MKYHMVYHLLVFYDEITIVYDQTAHNELSVQTVRTLSSKLSHSLVAYRKY
jgi:hypothetical protein